MSELPQGWTWAHVRDVCDRVVVGWVGPTAEHYVDDGVPMLRGTDIQRGLVRLSQLERISPEFHRSIQKSKVTPGDVVVVRIGRAGEAAVVPPELVEANCAGLVAIKDPSATLPDYLARYLNSPSGLAGSKAESRGVTRVTLNTASIANAQMPVAPLAEQRRIVAKLDALTARTARARADLDRIPALAARYKQAVLMMALSGRLTVDWRLQRSAPEGASQSATITTPFVYTLTAPSSWSGMPLLRACEIVGGSQPPKSTFVYADGEGLVRLIQIRDYKSDAHTVFIPERLARRFCDESDVMIGRYGPPVFQILRGLKGAYNVALMKAVPKDGLISKDYLYWLLSHPTLRRYVELDAKRTAGQDGVNKAHLEKFPIFLPPLTEQAEIVVRIEKLFAEIDRLVAEAAAARRLLDRLDQAVLAKAFRGELVPQDPADEPASVLLDRIRAERAAAPKAKRGRVAAR